MARDVVVIVGSVRKESLNLKLAHALAALAPDTLKLDIVPIGGLPLYNPDIEATPPPEWTAFRARVKKADAVLFVTPEHNRSVPAALKNASTLPHAPMAPMPGTASRRPLSAPAPAPLAASAPTIICASRWCS